MDLADKIWYHLDGGYKIRYNASIALRKLKEASRPDDFKGPFLDLWENLHHQGDVGLASYLAVPHIISICIEKKSFDWNFIGLCVTIENCRLNEHNPELPSEFENLYFDSLRLFEKYLLENFKNLHDRTALRLSLALFATLNGQPDLGKAIELLDEDEISALFEKYR
jgi:hypothetical protein